MVLKNKSKNKSFGGVSQVVEHLPSKGEALSSKSVLPKKKKERRRRRRRR
jgi:hypothetical protein